MTGGAHREHALIPLQNQEKEPIRLKICSGCKEHKPVTDFCINRTTKDGLNYYCKPCHYANDKKAREKYTNRNTGIPSIASKVCSRCRKTKTASEFALSRYSATGLCAHCKECDVKSGRQKTEAKRTKNRIWREANPEKVRLYNVVFHLRKKYGLSLEDVHRLLEEQNHECAICGVSDSATKLRVDHCHATGQIRALLCDMCNKGLGHFRDNPELLEKAAEYLKRHKEPKN